MSSRYLIGIDLGTTNSVVAYLDTHNTADVALIRVFPVPQLVGPGEVRTLPALPSFLYFPCHQPSRGFPILACIVAPRSYRRKRNRGSR